MKWDVLLQFIWGKLEGKNMVKEKAIDLLVMDGIEVGCMYYIAFIAFELYFVVHLKSASDAIVVIFLKK